MVGIYLNEILYVSIVINVPITNSKHKKHFKYENVCTLTCHNNYVKKTEMALCNSYENKELLNWLDFQIGRDG